MGRIGGALDVGRANLETAARVLGVRLLPLVAATESEVAAAFATIVEQRVGALLIAAGAISPSASDQIISLAGRYAVPTLFLNRDGPVSGALASYGASGSNNVFRQVGIYTGRILKMLWGGSGEHISIAALSDAMEPRHDETQNQECERFQPMSRPAGYGRDIDRGDRDESIELACCRHRSWCRARAAEETRDRRTCIAEPVEALAGGGREAGSHGSPSRSRPDPTASG